MLPIRWYDNERLDVGLDLVVLNAHDLAELIEAVNKPYVMKIEVRNVAGKSYPKVTVDGGDTSTQLGLTYTNRLDGVPEIHIEGHRVTVPTELWVDGTLVSIDPGLLWDFRAMRVVS